MDFLVACEPRLYLSCQAPACDSSQPLSLASMLEMERTLFLLARLARYSGAWHMLLPGSLPRFRWVAGVCVCGGVGACDWEGRGGRGGQLCCELGHGIR